MRILVSNDDGIESPGIMALADAVRDLGEVTVVAPHRERSTTSHSLTLHKPLRMHKVGEGMHSTSGTPADCVYLGIREVLKGAPDLLLSGINAGANLGNDIHYSGTVAAAREGALLKVKSYAFSLFYFPGDKGPLKFDMAAELAREVILKTKDLKFPDRTLLNVNIPNVERSQIRGIRVARQGFRIYANEVHRRTDPRGRDYFWIGGGYQGFEPNDASDCHWANEKFVTVTPITVDCTHDELYETLRQSFS